MSQLKLVSGFRACYLVRLVIDKDSTSGFPLQNLNSILTKYITLNFGFESCHHQVYVIAFCKISNCTYIYFQVDQLIVRGRSAAPAGSPRTRSSNSTSSGSVSGSSSAASSLEKHRNWFIVKRSVKVSRPQILNILFFQVFFFSYK